MNIEERINHLRLPSILSKPGEVEVWTAEDIGAAEEKCGLKGSPTRVIQTFENEAGRRKCKFISLDEIQNAIDEGLQNVMETGCHLWLRKGAIFCIMPLQGS